MSRDVVQADVDGEPQFASTTVVTAPFVTTTFSTGTEASPTNSSPVEFSSAADTTTGWPALTGAPIVLVKRPWTPKKQTLLDQPTACGVTVAADAAAFAPPTATPVTATPTNAAPPSTLASARFDRRLAFIAPPGISDCSDTKIIHQERASPTDPVMHTADG
jgi:hypothetical protein